MEAEAAAEAGFDRSGAKSAGKHRARRLALASGALCLLVLSGWTTGTDLLTRVLPGMPSMKVNAALAFLLLSVSIWRLGAGAVRLPLFGALVAMLLASATLLQWNTDAGGGLDNWLLQDLQTPNLAHPGRMAIATSLAVLLLGAGTLMARHGGSGLAGWKHLPSLLAVAVAYLAAIGLMVGVQWEGWLGVVIGTVSLPTATVILLLAVALLGLDDRAPVLPLTGTPLSKAATGFIRVALPLALLLPVLIAWPMEVALRRTDLPADAVHALASTVLGLAFGMLVLGSGVWIARLEASLRTHETSLRIRVAERTAQLGLAERRADESRRRLQQIVQEVDVGIVTVDPALNVVLFNGAAERMFGVTEAEMQGQPLARFLPAGAREQHPDWIRHFVATGVSNRRMGGIGQQLQALRADGQPFTAEATISRTQIDGTTFLTVVLRDMTAHLALESERRARELAEAASRAKSEQLGQISHELRTPLNAVIGFSDLMLLQRERLPSQDHVKWIGLIRDAGRHLLKLIADLTDLSRVDAGTEKLDLQPAQVQPLLRSVTELLATTAADAGVTLLITDEDAAADIWVHADERRLRQVMLNLVSNAIKYNRADGTVALRVLPPADGKVIVQVEDSGIGLSEDQLAHLFEPFNRVGRETSAIEGTGLGLVLSRSFVKAMGGRIEVRSEAGVGSVFSVVLPQSRPT